MLAKLKVFSDGGARGNPGPAAAAFLIFSEDGELVKAESRYLGRRTNNQAEYEALIAALEFAVQLGADDVMCYLDSELVGKHLTGEYSVKNPELRRRWSKVQELKRCFKQARFINVPRTNKYIQEADALVNERLDREGKLPFTA
jgi:ribonuclease HI